MKITKRKLIQLIKEELGKTLKESYTVDEIYDYSCDELIEDGEWLKAEIQNDRSTDPGMKMMIIDTINNRLDACKG
jgi:hypothetical protein